ncbi:MAG: hypothetical protein Q6373_019825 [Candidatus Sigynarchaeota archaeon]
MTEKNPQQQDGIPIKVPGSKEKAPRVFLPEETQSDLKEMTPAVSFEEIMSCNADETRAADKLVLLFGKYLSQYPDQQAMNEAMQVLYVASELVAKEGVISKHNIYQAFCSKHGTVEWETFLALIDPMTGVSSFAPLKKSGDELKFTSLGRVLLHNYQKLKAEMVAMQKYGALQDLFCMIDDIRSFWNYGQYGMDIEVIFSLINNLRNLIDAMKEEGDAILKDPTVDAKIQKIHDLIDQIMEIHETECKAPSELTIQQKVKLTQYLVEAIKELASISGRKFRTRLIVSRDAVLESPFPRLESAIIKEWDSKDWAELFYSCPTSCQPTQLSLKVSDFLLKKALQSFLKQKQEIMYGELPPEPSEEISRISMDQLLVKEKEMQTLKEKMHEKAMGTDSKVDYDVAKAREPYHFLDNLLMFYELAREKKIHVETEKPIRDITDKEHLIGHFTARSFTIIEKRRPGESQAEEVHA